MNIHTASMLLFPAVAYPLPSSEAPENRWSFVEIHPGYEDLVNSKGTGVLTIRKGKIDGSFRGTNGEQFSVSGNLHQGVIRVEIIKYGSDWAAVGKFTGSLRMLPKGPWEHGLKQIVVTDGENQFIFIQIPSA